MKLEKQVCSLESAKRLKELGVKQESLFYWSNPSLSEWEVIYYEDKIRLEEDFIAGRYHLVSAFTVAELGEMLPQYVEQIPLVCLKQVHGEGWIVKYHADYGRPLERITANTEAEARAKMLIYLIENDLIKLNGESV